MQITVFQLLTLIGVPTIVSTLFIWIITWWFNRRKEKNSVDYIMRKGLQAMLRQKQLEMHHKYVIIQKWIPVEYKASYDNMYQCYHALGNNGVMDDCYKDVMALPTEPIKKD